MALSIHSRGSHVVTPDELATLPAPVSLGNWHRPIPHSEVVHALREGVTSQGRWTPGALRIGIAQGGQQLFGTLDLQDSRATDARREELSSTLGFRSSTNRSLALKAVAGTHVFVCDNLCLSGDEILFSRKSTLHLDLPQQIAQGLDEFIAQDRNIHAGIERLKDTSLEPEWGDGPAKGHIFDLFNDEVLPLRCFAPLVSTYFAPEDTWTDCQGGTLWALQNACTRVTQSLSPQSRFETEHKIGRHFLQLVAD
jgi:hypothetical protein